jgi:hypothetical protein
VVVRRKLKETPDISLDGSHYPKRLKFIQKMFKEAFNLNDSIK